MILLTSENCQPCKAVKGFIESNGIKDKVNYVDVKSPDGRKLVVDQSIKSVPVLISAAGSVSGFRPILEVLSAVAKGEG